MRKGPIDRPGHGPSSLEELIYLIRSTPPRTFGGTPGWFRAHCATARSSGNSSYGDAGFHLGLHLARLEPNDLEPAEWLDLIATELRPLVKQGDDVAVLAWVVEHFPRCMEKVPRHRRGGFVAGFIAGFIRGEGGAA